jgi:uncharacterized lipoprotein YbaY
MPTNARNPSPRSILPASIVGMIAAIALAACQPAPRPDAASPLPTTPHAAKSGTALIHAQATYLERILMPAGATLDVQLIEDKPDATTTRILVTQHATDLRGPPFTFDVAYDPATIQAGAHYGLRASLRDSEGRLQFATAALVPVFPGSDAKVEFRLVRADLRQ